MSSRDALAFQKAAMRISQVVVVEAVFSGIIIVVLSTGAVEATRFPGAVLHCCE